MMTYTCHFWRAAFVLLLLATAQVPAQAPERDELAKYIRAHFTKQEQLISMRDGVRLCTLIYSPKDTAQRYPIMLDRTPYNAGPSGRDQFPNNLGPSSLFTRAGYIFVYQDVRGCYRSEGQFLDMRPHRDGKSSPKDVDESSDTYDTIDWLVKNVPNNNGEVGLWGISYPGFYSSAGMIDAHPSLKASSPQAPIADWFFDDFHHHGTLFLPHAFNFLATFGQARPQPTGFRPPRFDHHTPDGYQFFLELGSLKNVNERYFRDRIGFWNDLAAHPNYDAFWQARNLLPHLKNVAPAVLTVGGWFDAEDLYGALKTGQTVRKLNPGTAATLVMGPWRHGGWARGDGDRLGNIHFGSKTSLYYRKNIELPFFEHYLKGKETPFLPAAYMFETGANRWRTFTRWPPAEVAQKRLYFHADGKLTFAAPKDEKDVADEYVSDPHKPVPFTDAIAIGMTSEYMTDDQRFASRRPDVLVYQTEVLKEDVTLAGPMRADLWVATSGTDSDWVVKLIDVFPDDAKDPPDLPPGRHLGGYQMMVRSEAMRGRFRNSYEHPEPFVANQPTRVAWELQDVLHTFQAGHRIMVQVQSTWFPLIDRNPQKYVDNIFLADDKDFIKATEHVYRSANHPSALQVGVLPPG